MAVFRIPTSTDPRRPLYDQITVLDGSEYQLALEYNQRNGFWYLTIRDQDGTDLISGLQLVDGWPVNVGVLDPRLPNGFFQVFDLRQQHDSFPGLSDLGDRYELQFVTEDV